MGGRTRRCPSDTLPASRSDPRACALGEADDGIRRSPQLVRHVGQGTPTCAGWRLRSRGSYPRSPGAAGTFEVSLLLREQRRGFGEAGAALGATDQRHFESTRLELREVGQAEAEIVYKGYELVRQRTTEYGRVVGAHGDADAAPVQGADRVRGEVGDDAKLDVGPRTHVECDSLRHKALHERIVLDRADPVRD